MNNNNKMVKLDRIKQHKQSLHNRKKLSARSPIYSIVRYILIILLTILTAYMGYQLSEYAQLSGINPY